MVLGDAIGFMTKRDFGLGVLALLCLWRAVSCVPYAARPDYSADSAYAAADDARTFVAAVFEDVLKRTYWYDGESRRTALALFREWNFADLTPMVRDIAVMPIETTDDLQFGLDAIAVSGALGELTLLRDHTAAAINRARLNDPHMRTLAVTNLKHLGDWSSTEDILSLFRTTPADVTSVPVLTSAMEFLEAAPVGTTVTCDDLMRLLPLARLCSARERPSPYCGNFLTLMQRLASTNECRVVGEHIVSVGAHPCDRTGSDHFVRSLVGGHDQPISIC